MTMEGPGFLAVAIQPGKDTDLDAFTDWYNTEHGPLRLRLPFIQNGYRYRALDGKKPEWWAIYDVSELSHLNDRIYTRLREERSVREQAVMKTFDSLNRKLYKLVSDRGAYHDPAPAIFAVSSRFNEADTKELDRYFEKEYTEKWSQVPGWLWARRFKVVGGELPPDGQFEQLIVHGFESGTSIANQNFASMEEQDPIAGKAISSEQRTWERHLVFNSLKEPPSTVITTDGAHLRFQLEGNPADPVIVCVNSIMTTLSIWNNVTTALISGVGGKSYRVLRYNPRGYCQQDPKSNPTTFDILTDDLEYLLQRLRIDKVHAVIGVSMGGVTSLNFAIRHPDMLTKFVACDCNVSSSPANSQAWAERVQLAQKEGMDALAKATVERWFTPENHGSAAAERVNAMVAEANLEGFRLNSLALSDYDLKPRLSEIKVPGLLVAGEGDGKIPEAMRNFGIADTKFQAIPSAGHLPFLENHEAFVEALEGFL